MFIDLPQLKNVIKLLKYYNILYAAVYTQVYLNKLEYSENVFLVNYFKKLNLKSNQITFIVTSPTARVPW